MITSIVTSLGGLVLLLASQTGWCLFLRRLLGIPIPFLFLATFALHSHVLFAFSVLDVLNWGVYCQVLLGLIFLIFFLIRDRSFAASLFTSETITFFFVCLFFCVKYHSATYVFHDEISYWGLFLKHLHHTGQLPGPDSSIPFGSYPPHIPLLYHYFCVIMDYSEGAAYIALACVSFSCLIPLVSFDPAATSWKKLIVLGFAYVSSIAIGATWQMLLVDKLIGFIWAAVLIAGLTFEKKQLWPFLALALPYLAMTKPTVGNGFALLSLALIVVYRLRSIKVEKLRMLDVLPLVACLVLTVCAGVFWNHCSERRGLATFSPSAHYRTPVSEIRRVFSEQATEEENEIIKRFAKAFLVTPTFFYKVIPPFVFWAFLTFAALSLCLFTQDDPPTVFAFQSLISSGCIVYAFSLLFMYLFFFSRMEGLSLAQFERYFSTYLVGWSIILFFQMLQMLHQHSSFWIVAALALAVAFGAGPKSAWSWRATPALEGRLENSQIVQDLCQEVPARSRVYVVGEGLSLIDFRILRFALAPRPSNIWNWMTGTPSNDPHGLYRFSIDQFTADIGKYEYLLLVGNALPFASSSDAGLNWETQGPARMRLFQILSEDQLRVRFVEKKRCP